MSDPESVVRRYRSVLYNERRLDLIPELIADPEIRHAPVRRIGSKSADVLYRSGRSDWGVHRLDAPHFATVGPTVASHLTWAEALCSWAGIDHPVVMSTYESLRRSMPPEDAVAPCFLGATRDPPISHRKPPFAYVRAF